MGNILVTLAAACAPGRGGAAEPAPKAALRPFDQGIYSLAYGVFLANRNLPEALELAEAAVRQRPASLEWREKLAQVAEWAGEPAEALAQWGYLASHRRGAADYRSELRLGGMLRDFDAKVAAWEGLAALGPLDQKEWSMAVSDCEDAGRPQAAIDLLRARGASLGPAALYREAEVQVRMGRDADALGTLERCARIHGEDADNALARTAILIPLGRLDEAFAILASARGRAPAARDDFWRALGKLARWRQDEGEAMVAAESLLVSERWRVEDVQGLLDYLGPRRPDQASELAWQAWRKFRNPAWFAYRLDGLVSASRWDEALRILSALPPKDREALDEDAYYHDLASRVWQRAGDWDQARREYARALALDPGSQELRAGYLWLLIDQNRVAEVKRWASAWEGGGNPKPVLRQALAAAYVILHQDRKALAAYQALAPAHAGDLPFLVGYADALRQSGAGSAAGLALRQAERVATRGPAPGDTGAWLAARARLEDLQGNADGTARWMDASRRYRAGAGEGDGTWLAWRLERGAGPSELGLTLARARAAGLPVWAQTSLARAEGDRGAVRALLDRDGDALSAFDRAEAAQYLGDAARARAYAFEGLQDHPGDAALAGLYQDLLFSEGRRWQAGSDWLGRPSMAEYREGAEGAVPLGEAAWLRPSAVQWYRPRVSADVRAAAGKAGPVLAEGDWGVAGQYQARYGSAGAWWRWRQPQDARLRPDAAHPALAAYGLRPEWRPRPDLAMAAAWAVDSATDANSAMAVASVEDAVSVQVSREGAADSWGLELGREDFRDWGRRRLGTGLEARAQALKRFSQAYPDLALGATAEYRAYSARIDSTAKDGTPLLAGYFPLTGFPQSFAQAGLRLSLGEDFREYRSHALRPYGAAGLSGTYFFRHTRFQPEFWEPGYEAEGGVAGGLFGHDRLRLYLAYLEGRAHPPESEARAGFGYEYFIR